MTATEAREIAAKARQTLEYEYDSIMKVIKNCAERGNDYMSVPVTMSNQLRERLVNEGYTITSMTLYWQVTPMTKNTNA